MARRQLLRPTQLHFGDQLDQKRNWWGLSLLDRVKRAPRYFLRRGSLESLMFFKMAPSTDFWASSLSLETSFFYSRQWEVRSKSKSEGWSYLGCLVEELGLSSLLGLLLFLEEGIVDLCDVGSLDVNLGACGQSVSLVHALKGNSVDLVWARDQKEAGWQLLQENNTSATEASSKEDEDGSWDDALAELSSLGLEGLLVMLLLVFSGVPSDLLDHFTY